MIYELRDYVATAGAAERLHARFADHTFGLFARHGLEVVGFWTDVDDDAHIRYLLRFPDDDTRRKAWAAFQGDPEWKAVKAASEADGSIVAEMNSHVLVDAPYWHGSAQA